MRSSSTTILKLGFENYKIFDIVAKFAIVAGSFELNPTHLRLMVFVYSFTPNSKLVAFLIMAIINTCF